MIDGAIKWYNSGSIRKLVEGKTVDTRLHGKQRSANVGELMTMKECHVERK